MKLIGIIPARMKSSRFPGKPLHKIAGRPMIEHVYRRAAMFSKWDRLAIATCDQEIADFGKSKGWEVIMTSPTHTRCLDRVEEATNTTTPKVEDDDIVVCVQGDEPLLRPDMIECAVKPCLEDARVPCTALALEIREKATFEDPNALKIAYNLQNDILYASRASIPYCKEFDPAIGAYRMYGIFAFKKYFLRTFSSLPESPLEKKEACDSNRISDYGYRQRMAPYPAVLSYSVDCLADVTLVENALVDDPLRDSY